jgi:hypothetical protein
MIFDLLYEATLEGLSKGMSLKDIADKHQVDLNELLRELSKGISTEKEHTDSVSIAKKIAKDHLVEDPKYYTKLSKTSL